MLVRLFFLVVLLLLTKGLGSLGLEEAPGLGHHAAIAFGFLILAGSLAGEWARRVGLPSITGYILAGILCGPDLLEVLNEDVVRYLAGIDELALFFIALTAGAELRWSSLKPRLGRIVSVAAGQLLLGGALVAGAYMLCAPFFPFLSELTLPALIAAACLLGVISAAVSPATTVAVIVETHSAGPLRDTALGATVLLDVAVILVFALVLSLAAPLLGAPAGDHGIPRELLALFFSLLCGGLVGFAFIWYLHRVGKLLHLVIIAAGLFLVRLAQDLHLDALMLALAAGFVIANFSDRGRNFLDHLEEAALPVFLVFFGLAGAALDLQVLARLWPAALLFVALRAAGKWLGTGAGALLSRGETAIRRVGWMSFLGQAGVSLGFAAVAARELPVVGPQIREVVVAAVVLNQVIGPVLFKMALERSGEIGRASR